ncbi:hypothetical protein BN59_02951 [Legionella massiliensis]|uniref:Ankyrin repeats (3 copies) n=1 Tax=Legionella massiliensis TaxID=1034943 RepID=A0A078L3D9_9GAMM|nr:hypothetical protein [Legionella massiliensis]CDZ78639.1 hypothetical protein BN59_02951 [Legionella massiliensis]CEE14377.1 hypothetical protein BN1094_02951 [Legionella massiliensis]
MYSREEVLDYRNEVLKLGVPESLLDENLNIDYQLLFTRLKPFLATGMLKLTESWQIQVLGDPSFWDKPLSQESLLWKDRYGANIATYAVALGKFEHLDWIFIHARELLDASYFIKTNIISINVAVILGNTKFLDWLKAKNYELSVCEVACTAARMGSIPVLDWLKTNFDFPELLADVEEFVNSFVTEGTVESIQWLNNIFPLKNYKNLAYLAANSRDPERFNLVQALSESKDTFIWPIDDKSMQSARVGNVVETLLAVLETNFSLCQIQNLEQLETALCTWDPCFQEMLGKIEELLERNRFLISFQGFLEKQPQDTLIAGLPTELKSQVVEYCRFFKTPQSIQKPDELVPFAVPEAVTN